MRHGLIEPRNRRRRREDYKRWKRSRSMELWQMDVVGEIFLADDTKLSAVTGIDDHSRFCVCAKLVARATTKPVCDALVEAVLTAPYSPTRRFPCTPAPRRSRRGAYAARPASCSRADAKGSRGGEVSASDPRVLTGKAPDASHPSAQLLNRRTAAIITKKAPRANAVVM